MDYSIRAVLFWNMDTLQKESTPEEHHYLIRCSFQTKFKSAGKPSFDKSVRLWDAANVIVSALSFMISHRPWYGNHIHNSCIQRPCFCSSSANNQNKQYIKFAFGMNTTTITYWAIVCMLIQGTLHMLCPQISVPRRTIFSVFVTVTMKLAI